MVLTPFNFIKVHSLAIIYKFAVILTVIKNKI